jgi:uncharacterized protein YggE
MMRLTSRAVGLGVSALLAVLVLTLVGCSVAPPTPAPAAAAPGATGATGAERAVAAQAQPATDSAGISVSGDGRVLVTPDIARVTLGVEVRNAALAAAQAEAATRIDAVLNLLKQAGIDEKDIRTVQYHVQPITRFDERERRPVSEGYQVTHLLQVTFRDIKALGQRLDQITQAGATNIHGIQFDLADPAAAANQAREQAVAEARRRADHLARLTGVTLGRPLSISEGGGPLPPPQPVRAAPAAEAGAAPPTQIEPGQTEVRVTVHIRYAIQ